MDLTNITIYSSPIEKIVIGSEKNAYILVYAISKKTTIKIIHLKNKYYEWLHPA
jgi:hypothetical protein